MTIIFIGTKNRDCCLSGNGLLQIGETDSSSLVLVFLLQDESLEVQGTVDRHVDLKKDSKVVVPEPIMCSDFAALGVLNQEPQIEQ